MGGESKELRGNNLLMKIVYFYYDGFRSMTIGKKLWIIILVKLFVLFVILRLFFFHDFLKTRFDNDHDRSKYVIDQLTK